MAIGVGSLHLGLVLADLSPAETPLLRLVEFLLVAFVAGAILGLLLERKWIVFCLVGSWGAIMAAAMLFAMDNRLWIHVGFGSIAAILSGGLVGTRLRRLEPVHRRIAL